jgi:hypothetical protein
VKNAAIAKGCDDMHPTVSSGGGRRAYDRIPSLGLGPRGGKACACLFYLYQVLVVMCLSDGSRGLKDFSLMAGLGV